MPTRLSVTTLRLAQFRSYRFAEIETDGRSVALHGPNGAGKTNLLEAVSLLVPGRGLRSASSEDFARRPEGAGWRIRAALFGPDPGLEVVTGLEGEGSRQVEIDGKSTTQSRLGHHIRQVWLTPAMDRLWVEGASERRRFLDRMTLGFTPEHAETSIAYEKAMRARNRLLKEGQWHDAWLSGIEAQMARAGAKIAHARAMSLTRLLAAQSGAETLFPRADLAILGPMETRFSEALRAGEVLEILEEDEAAGFAERLGHARGQDAIAGRTLEGPHRSDLDAVYAAKAMPARACSTGEQKALLLSLCLANARALSTETDATPILLMDEVAAHLDADRRRALYTEIAAIGAQAWMTGTGPELFEGLDGAMQVAVTEGVDGTRLDIA
ncbi:MAG: DNA replication/repair protein RecF [Pseudomonadota bacterium]